MPQIYKFKNIVVHTIPENRGWQIYGVTKSNQQILIAALTTVMSLEEVRRLAKSLAVNLTGTTSYTED